MMSVVSKILLSSILFFSITIPILLRAQVMQGGTYRIQSDSINFGGGLSTSTNYVVSDTLGEVGTGFSTSSSYALNAGFQALQAVYISITDSSNITLPNISGVSGGNSSGQSTWTVVTDDLAGYSLTVAAATSPALKSAQYSILDYVPSGSDPDYNFNVGNASSTFGFSPEGINIIQRYKDNGSACNTGAGNTVDKCWDGLSTTPKLIAQSASSNHPAGATTTVKYLVGIGSNKIQEPGTYTANLTVTALPL